MDTEKKQKQLDLEDEYMRIAQNEEIYYDEISLWAKSKNFTVVIYIIGFALMIVSFSSWPSDASWLELLSDYSLEVAFFFVGVVAILASLITRLLASNKISKIKAELGLHRDERTYLWAYETFTTINSYLKESSPKRKLYFKRLALQNTEELTSNVEGWKYGNIPLVASLIGNKIDLLKDNMRRLVLSNVAKGDEVILKRISEILVEFCKFMYSPSPEKLDELNDMIKEIPFKEYKYLTRKERMSRYVHSKPRIFRLIFASVITIAVIIILLCLEQNVGLTIAVGVTCFWGSFSGFDKIFRLKEERSK